MGAHLRGSERISGVHGESTNSARPLRMASEQQELLCAVLGLNQSIALADGGDHRPWHVPVYSDANIEITSGTAPIYFIKLDDRFVSESGPSSLASPHTAAAQIAWLLRTHTVLGVTHRYPEALVKVTGFTAATTGFGGS
jgi:hypothetical protein